MSKRETKLNKNKAVAILIYNSMNLGERYPTTHFMKLLELSQNYLYRGIDVLRKNKLIKTYNGNNKGGLEKSTDLPLEKLCTVLNVAYEDDTNVIDNCDEVIDEVRKPVDCDICSESVMFVDKHGVCIDCLELKEPVAAPKLARCGHLSSTRYFVCEQCQPELESDDIGPYRTSLTKRYGGM